MYSDEIDNELNYIPYYKGAIPKDYLNGMKVPYNKNFCCVLNLENSNEDGSHWTCIFNDKKENYTEYIDSYGIKPPIEAVNFIKRNFHKELVYNDNQLQKDGSVRCGYFCMYYLKNRASGKSSYDTIYSLKQEPSKFNENIVVEQ